METGASPWMNPPLNIQKKSTARTMAIKNPAEEGRTVPPVTLNNGFAFDRPFDNDLFLDGPLYDRLTLHSHKTAPQLGPT